VPVRLPTFGPFLERLGIVADSTRTAKQQLRGASTAVLSPALRLLDRCGMYQHFIDHQRRVHTFVSNVRGPAEALELLGHPLLELIPLSLAAGNVTVAFTALSYGGRLVLTVNADPVTCPDVDRLVDALGDQLASSVAKAPGSFTAEPGGVPAAGTSRSWPTGGPGAGGPSLQDRLVLRLLMSPAHRLLDGTLVGLRLHGVVTGRVRELPVMAARDEGGLVVYVGQSATKRWWRNLRQPSEVQLLDAGAWGPATAEVLRPGTPEWQRARLTYGRRWPRVVVDATDPLVRVRPASWSSAPRTQP
jgi:hypothetical protein